jgi:hypothetical protein
MNTKTIAYELRDMIDNTPEYREMEVYYDEDAVRIIKDGTIVMKVTGNTMKYFMTTAFLSNPEFTRECLADAVSKAEQKKLYIEGHKIYTKRFPKLAARSSLEYYCRSTGQLESTVFSALLEENSPIIDELGILENTIVENEDD